jgi:hypothetical protein
MKGLLNVVGVLLLVGFVFGLDFIYDFPGWTQLDQFGLWYCEGPSAWWGQVCL